MDFMKNCPKSDPCYCQERCIFDNSNRNDNVQLQPAYINPIHRYAYRRPNGELPMIVGVKFVQPTPNMKIRPCYVVKYKDGFTDYVPISDVSNGHYDIVVDQFIG